MFIAVVMMTIVLVVAVGHFEWLCFFGKEGDRELSEVEGQVRKLNTNRFHKLYSNEYDVAKA